MNAKGWMMLNALLNKFHPGSQDALLKYLPEEDRKKPGEQPVDAEALSKEVYSPELFIEKIHLSWLLSLVEKFPDSMQEVVLNLLPQNQAKSIAKKLNIPYHPHKIADGIKEFTSKILYSRLQQEEILPASFLPSTPWNELLNWNRDQLVELIGYLGIYDLAAEFRQTIDQKLLNESFNLLSSAQREYLKFIIRTKSHPPLQIRVLKALEGDQGKMERFLQHQGLGRLGAALKGQHPHFMWYLSRILDKGRAELLMKNFQMKKSSFESEDLPNQMQTAMEYVNQSEAT